MNVSIMGLRAYVENEELLKALQPYGEIEEDIVCLKYKADHDLARPRKWKSTRENDIMQAVHSLLSEDNQQPICRECSELGYSRGKCPKILSRLCHDENGHMSHDCPT